MSSNSTSSTEANAGGAPEAAIEPIGVQQQSRLEQYFLRPLFVFVTFLLVLFALVQASGRFAMATLHLFDSEISALAETQGVVLNEIQGDWSRFNPVVNVAEVVFPGGRATDVSIELDLFGSAWHNDLVARRIAVGEVALDVVQTDQGWRLDAPVREQQFDPTALINFSGEISGNAKVHLTNSSGLQSTVPASVVLRNQYGDRYALLTLGDQADPLRVALWQLTQGMTEPQVQALAMGGELRLPAALVKQDSIIVRVSEGRFSGTDGLHLWYGDESLAQGRGVLRLEVADVDLPGADLNASLGLTLQRVEDDLVGQVQELALSADGEVLSLPVAMLTGSLGAEPRLGLWFESLDLTSAADFFGKHFPEWKGVGEWSHQADIQGELKNVHLIASSDIGFGYGDQQHPFPKPVHIPTAATSQRGHRVVHDLGNGCCWPLDPKTVQLRRYAHR